jgi:hypothetical protein
LAYATKEEQKVNSNTYYQRNKEEVKANNRVWKKNNPIKVYMGAVRRRARSQKLKFDLDFEWFKERIDNGVCEVTGLYFVDSGKPMTPFMKSVDRTNPEGGYTKDNCKMVIWMYNAGKGGNSHSDLMVMAKALCTQS